MVPIENDSNPEPDPEWGLEVIFTKRAEINYGPWVDLQRSKTIFFYFQFSFYYYNEYNKATTTSNCQQKKCFRL